MATAALPSQPPVPQVQQVQPVFKTLVKVLASMFYAGQCPPAWWVDAADPKKEPDPELAFLQPEKKAAQLNREAKRKAQQDTTGLGIILLTALTELQWVEEDEFARTLNLPPKMVRRAMRYLEQEQVVQREHRKESVRMRKHERDMMNKAGLRQAPGAAAAAGDAAAGAEPEEEEAIVSKGHVITYCALDYPRIVDSVRWRLYTIKETLQKEIRNNNAVQEYKCTHPQCGKEFSSMDVWQLISRDGNAASKNTFSCTICQSEVQMKLDLDGKELGSMNDKKQRQQKAREMFKIMDKALEPLTDQLKAVAAISPPDFGAYPTWLQQQAALKQRLDAIAAQAAKGGAGSSRQSAAMPAFTQDTQVVVNIAGPSSEANNQGSATLPGTSAGLGAAAAQIRAAGTAGAAAAAGGALGQPGGKQLPPWLLNSTQTTQQQQAPAAKPIPPWLMSSSKQSLGAGSSQQQQLGGSTGFDLGMGVKAEGMKAEGSGLELKPDPGVKLEGLKPDPGFKQEDDMDADMWESVPGSVDDVSAGGAAAGSSQGGSLAAALDAPIDDDEDWEDVV